jgi:hypothetical protein
VFPAEIRPGSPISGPEALLRNIRDIVHESPLSCNGLRICLPGRKPMQIERGPGRGLSQGPPGPGEPGNIVDFRSYPPPACLCRSPWTPRRLSYVIGGDGRARRPTPAPHLDNGRAPPVNWADLQEDKMINPAPGLGPIFDPLGPTAGPGSLGTGPGSTSTTSCTKN